MKKKIFGGILVVALTMIGVFNINLNTKNNDLSLLNLANIEALAAGETPTQIDVKTCFDDIKKKSGTGRYFLECDSRTTSTTIYSCPTNTTEGSSISGYSTTKCIKN